MHIVAVEGIEGGTPIGDVEVIPDEDGYMVEGDGGCDLT